MVWKITVPTPAALSWSVLTDLNLLGCLTPDELFDGSSYARCKLDQYDASLLEIIKGQVPSPTKVFLREIELWRDAAVKYRILNLSNRRRCPFCGVSTVEVGLRNARSAKEFEISGICQPCQDKFFGLD